jgi:hypothetical protein
MIDPGPLDGWTTTRPGPATGPTGGAKTALPGYARNREGCEAPTGGANELLSNRAKKSGLGPCSGV